MTDEQHRTVPYRNRNNTCYGYRNVRNVRGVGDE